MAKQVFVLMHSHEMPAGEEDIKLIGVYSSEAAANSAVARAKSLPGFSQTPAGFHVQAYPLDKDHWTEGFVTELPSVSGRTTARKSKRSTAKGKRKRAARE